MIDAFFLAAAMMTGPAGIAPERWFCRSEVEVWCEEGRCAAKPLEETTPLSVTASGDRSVSVCAYSGCWEAEGAMLLTANGRSLWVADRARFSSRPEGGFETDLTVLIVEGGEPGEGAGFVRAGGLATPLICLKPQPEDEAGAP